MPRASPGSPHSLRAVRERPSACAARTVDGCIIPTDPGSQKALQRASKVCSNGWRLAEGCCGNGHNYTGGVRPDTSTGYDRYRLLFVLIQVHVWNVWNETPLVQRSPILPSSRRITFRSFGEFLISPPSPHPFLECIAAPGGNTCILRNQFMNLEQVAEKHGISSVLRIISEWLLSLRGKTLHRDNPSTTFFVVMDPKYVAGHEVSAGMLGLGTMGQCKQRRLSSPCHMLVEGTERWLNSDAPPFPYILC